LTVLSWHPHALGSDVVMRIFAVVAICAISLAATANAVTRAGSRWAIVLRSFHYVDSSRVAHFRNGTDGPRRLLTYVRYPRSGHAPFPLIVFAHGFTSTPATYARLLDAWTRAGYVVAAPVFPVENANAPGGPDENDLINEPRDISFVVSQLLAANTNPASPLDGLIEPGEIAVAGHSDGAEAALAAAYDHRFADPRFRAAVILSGGELGGRTTWFGSDRSPLLAVQGTADAINPPRYTTHFFRAAQPPKFLLELLRGGHRSPYTTNERELTIVERTTIAFLNHYLKHRSLLPLTKTATVPGIARLISDT
jgi:fermentation-respiration switch protein FrsA (DUF1100 family)